LQDANEVVLCQNKYGSVRSVISFYEALMKTVQSTRADENLEPKAH